MCGWLSFEVLVSSKILKRKSDSPHELVNPRLVLGFYLTFNYCEGGSRAVKDSETVVCSSDSVGLKASCSAG
jgi:hypothetical protein